MKQTTAPLLHVRYDSGTGNPLVLIHGMFAEGSQWDKIAPLLARNFRVISIDLLGHGKSPRPKNAKYTPEEHVDALRNTLEALSATENLTLVGYSMGGAVALAYCAEYHDVAQLYLISTPFYLDAQDMIDSGYANSLAFTKLSLGFFYLVERLLRPGGRLNTYIEKNNQPKWLTDFTGTTDNPLDPYIVQENLKNLIRKFPFIKMLSKVTAPITFYAGKRDVYIIQSQIYALRKVQPYMDIERLDIVKIDHMLVQNLPKEIAAMVSKHAEQTLHVGFDNGVGPVIVLLHGIESSSVYWKTLAPVLARDHRVIALDLLGFGKSPKPLNIAYTLTEHAEWVKHTLDTLGVHNAHFVGHSLGTLVSVTLADLYPGLVNRTTLFSPVITGGAEINRFIVKRMNTLGFFSNTNTAVTATMKTIGESRIQTYVPLLRSVNNAINKQQPFLEKYTKLNIPTTIAYAANDSLVDEKPVAAFAKKLKSVTIKKIPGAGHNFPMTHPAETAKLLGVKEGTQKLRPTKLPKANKVVRHLFRDAAPIMFLKSVLLLTTGLLLFSSYAKATLVVALCLYVLTQGIKTIRGAFSLKNEGLSYISYALLGVAGACVAYILVQHPTFSLKVSILVICGLAFLLGISKIVSGWAWTKDNKYLRNKEIITGIFLATTSTAAILLQSIVGLKAIVYTIAILLLLRAVIVMAHLVSIASLAFIRGYN